ncbi:TetR/AcrR family transcriptional regulator [Nocardia arthritidis]|nr:TetR/AcrR family transcriptional regulator [Nocardia arthritidis]
MDTVAAPSTSKGQATRERLLAAARAEAVESGGHIEVAAVAARAGVVPSLINRYFRSKPGLVCALVDEFFDRFETEVLRLDLDATGTWAEHEYARLIKGVEFNYADPFAVVLYGQLTRDPLVAQTETARIEAIIRGTAAGIRRAQRRGELPARIDAELAGAAMFGAMRQVMVAALRRTPPPSPTAVVDILWPQVAASVGLAAAARNPLNDK